MGFEADLYFDGVLSYLSRQVNNKFVLNKNFLFFLGIL